MTDVGGTGRASRDRGQTPWIAPESSGRSVRCQLCGAVNGAPAGFCRWCGTPLGRPTDPVLGTTTRRALESQEGNPVGAILGAIAATAVIAVTGWLLLGGGLASLTPPATSSPTATIAPSAEPSPSTSGEPSVTPTETVGPTATPTLSPAPSPSAGETVPPTETGVTCDPATIADPNSAAWQVDSITWSPRARFDELQVLLDLRRAEAGRPTTADIESLGSADLPDFFGLEGPSTERAVVITFSRSVRLPNSIDVETGMDTIQEVQVADGSDGLAHVVVGVVGEGCYRLRAPDWESTPPLDQASIILEVRR